MDYYSDDKQDKSHLTESMIEYDKNTMTNLNLNKGRKDIMLNSFNDYSELKQNFPNSQLKNISINFGFPNTRNTYKYRNSIPLSEFPMFEQRNYFYYDKNFQLFKNKSISKYGEKKNKTATHLSQQSRSSKFFSPQHKITTTIKKKKYLDDQILDEKASKKTDRNEKDIYELEVVNQVLFDDEDTLIKKNLADKHLTMAGKEIDNEWGEIEQEIFENEKNKKNNLLNSVYVEIEKENGDKQLKIVEITKENKFKKEPCIKIKYTIEDKICLNAGLESGEEPISSTDKETAKDSMVKSFNYKTNTDSTFNNNYSLSSLRRPEHSSLKKENVSEILLKESKSSQNLFSSPENEKKFFSDVTSPAQKYQKYSKYKEESYKRKEKTPDSEQFKKDTGFGVKRTPRASDIDEIEIKIEKGVKSKISPIRGKDDDVKIYSPRFKTKDQDNSRTNITDRYRSFDEQDTRSEKEFFKGKGIRDKYLQKKDMGEKGKDLKVINLDKKKGKYGDDKYNNITTQTKKKTEMIPLSKQKSFDNYNIPREKEAQLFRYKIKQNQLETDKNKKDNLGEAKYGFRAKYDNRVNTDENIPKKEGFNKYFDLSDNRIDLTSRDKERERKDKERKERQKLEIEKEIERMERDKERQRLEKLKEREKARKEREEKERKERERLENEKKERERIERVEREKKEKLAQERRERERQEFERQRKEKERQQELEKQQRERERERERQELEKQKKERERQQELERQQKEKQREKERQEYEKQKKERERQLELERQQKEREKEKERQELERQKREREKERERQQKEREKLEREKQLELERQKKEKERQKEL